MKKIFILGLLFFQIIVISSPARAQKEKEGLAKVEMGEVGIEQTIADSVPQPEGSAVHFDRRTGNLIITNTAENLEAAERLILSLDQVPFQVEIETKFIDIDMEKVAALGINWVDIGAGTGGASGSSRWELDIDLSQPDRTTERFFSGLRAMTGEGLSVSLARLQDIQFRATLDTVRRIGGANILSVPRITTLNHREARIELMNEAVEQEWKEEQEFDYAVWQYLSAGTTITQEVAIPTDFVTDQWGVFLTVVPHIGADMKTITLELRPRIKERLGVDPYGAIQYGYRDMDTTVVIEDGETVVMGGLIRSKKTQKQVRVPVLGTLPVLGRLFRQDATSDEDRNLLVFTTVHLLNPKGERLLR